MLSKVTLTVTQGKLIGQKFIFDSRTTCIIGRNPDCHPRLPDDENHRTISRYHCLLDINPPAIRVRDFGSLNGTYVNGEKIGQRLANQTPEAGAKMQFPEYDLQDGDEIKLGDTVWQISIKITQPEINIPPLFSDTINMDNNSIKQLNILEKMKYLLGLAAGDDKNLFAIHGYQILKLLGKGGCGEVYLAQHNQSEKLIALKVMLPAIIKNDYAVQMFLRETENTKALRHPNVVKLIDYGYSDNIFFFTMEYCEGGSVSDLMRLSGGILAIDVAVPIILQVLDGLEYTHNAEIPYIKLADGSLGKGKGLVHRDLKPSNIFLSKVDNKLITKIGDYGLSKAFDIAGLSGQTFSGAKAGTAFFMSRQQVLNFKYAQPDVDIWATAACLYYMLTGDFPRNFTFGDQFLAVLQNEPVPIKTRNPHIPKPLAEIIDLALVEKPEIYFKTANEFKEALLAAFYSVS